MKNGRWEEFKERYRKEEKVIGVDPRKEFAKLTRKWQRMTLDVKALCRKF